MNDNVQIVIKDEEMLSVLLEKLIQCPNITVNINIQTIGDITNSAVNMVNANGHDIKIDCKAKKGGLV